MRFQLFATMALTLAGFPCVTAEERDLTCFQSGAPYSPQLDIGSDMAIVYGVNAGFAERVAQWREQGYAVGMMTGISWGDYGDYYQTPTGLKKEEVQTTKSGQLFMHGLSTTVGYNVPTPAYLEYIKRYVSPAVDAGVRAVFLEEPEYWAETGWSEAFKREWQRFYGEPWQAPDESVDAQYRASKLKYRLYYDALREVQAHIKARAADQGRTIECHVPTHSLISYAHWRIVSPMSSLMELTAMDGYIAQVWTGTARTPNVYRGVRKERTFETAYLEYGQMASMVRPTGRKVWFLADPIEDNPNHSWSDYRWNYECTVIASLMWPEVGRFEVMPWPNRVFQGTYPKVDMDTRTHGREGIPADYATELLTVINALNDMDQSDVEESGTRGIGVVVSDTMMFQRAAPMPSDGDLGSFFGLALPLVKHGIPVEPAQLEAAATPGAFDRYKLLLLTYEGQKPLKPEYHDQLAAWVNGGGLLLIVDDGSDPYNHVREWWNDGGGNGKTPLDDLLSRLEADPSAADRLQPVGQGGVWLMHAAPRDLQTGADGAVRIIDTVKTLLASRGVPLETRHYLRVRRGPYVAASVLDESTSDEPVSFEGTYVNLFDPMLGVTNRLVLAANERALLYDLDWIKNRGDRAKVVAAAARIRGEQYDGNTFSFTMRGPAGTTGRARILLPCEPAQVTAWPELALDQQWDEASGTLWLAFPNIAAPVTVTIVSKAVSPQGPFMAPSSPSH